MLKRFIQFVATILDDLLFLAGGGLIVYATYLLSLVAALYVAGGLCILVGVLVAISRRSK
jgi:hypothetical protein